MPVLQSADHPDGTSARGESDEVSRMPGRESCGPETLRAVWSTTAVRVQCLPGAANSPALTLASELGLRPFLATATSALASSIGSTGKRQEAQASGRCSPVL